MAPTPPAHWQRALTLLDVALAMAPATREQWLAETAACEPDIVPLLRKLLKSHDRVETHDILATLPKVLKPARGVDGAAAGQQVGPFELIEPLGRGGMGSVWRARYADGRLKRDVAVKLPASTDDAQTLATLRERFARERDFLAQLQHPHIARLYDAGVSESGQPYLAMEYVAGKAIDVYCDEQRLTVKARLNLFLQVLDAVAYAHQQLVLHRDLKPGNVLVDGQQQVRLLDFGVARLLPTEGVGPTEAASDLTERAGAAFTLSYAAPEQINRGALSTATDVYALGVMLYQLLTGLSPYQPLRDTRGSLEDAVLVSMPELASGRSFSGEALQARQTTAAGLRKSLVNDLDVILSKALKKEPGERYATAEALATDLRRHLAQQPISARADSWWYRAHLFVARNRLVVGGSTLAVAALIATTSVAIWQAQVSAANAARAVKEATRAGIVRQFLATQFSRADPEKNKDITPADRVAVDRALATAARDFAADKQTLVAVLKQLGAVYLNLGVPDKYLEVQKLRVSILEGLPETAVDELVSAQLELADALGSSEREDDRAQAMGKLQAALAIATAKRASSEVLIRALCRIADRYVRDAKLKEADAYAARAVTLAERVAAGKPTEDLSYAYVQRGKTLAQLGQFEEARQLIRRSLDIDATGHGRSEVEQVHTLNLAVRIEYEAGDYLAAMSTALRTLDFARARLGPMEGTLLTTKVYSVLAAERAGDTDKATRMAAQLLAEDLQSTESFRAGAAHYAQGVVALSRGEVGLADRSFRAAEPRLTTSPKWALALAAQRAHWLLVRGHAPSAAQFALPVLDRARQAGRGQTEEFAQLAERAGVALARQGRLDAARGLFDEACESRRRVRPLRHPDRVRCESYLTLAATGQGDGSRVSELKSSADALAAERPDKMALIGSLRQAALWVKSQPQRSTTVIGFPLLN